METPTDPPGRITALGNHLIEVHGWLREELAALRADVDAHLAGHGGRPRQLRAHCLAFCSALSQHHTGEDDGIFPVLSELFPELRPVLDELARDHQMVTEILHSLEELVDRLGSETDPAKAQQVRAELDGLAALLELHFGYEEKRLVLALNSVNVQAGRPKRMAANLAVSADGAAQMQVDR